MSNSNVKEWPGRETEQEMVQPNASLEAPEPNNANEAEPPQRNRRGIYLLPNLLTTGTLFGGFYAILMGLGGNFEAAAIAIFAAMFFDGLDGRVARLTNTQSEFGVEYDSLSDMVAFGVAPAVLVFTWMLEPLGKFGWSVAFIYVSCAALRLARFNVKTSRQDNRYFTGLASPPAAALVAGMVWSGSSLDASWLSALVPAVLTAVAGFLMVSNIRYPSFKEVNFAHKVPFAVVLGICVVIAVIMVDPPRVLLFLAFVYALHAPLIAAIKNAKQIKNISIKNYLKRINILK